MDLSATQVSEVALASTRRDLTVLAYQLTSAVGRLNAESLGTSPVIYDPTLDTEQARRMVCGRPAGRDEVHCFFGRR